MILNGVIFTEVFKDKIKLRKKLRYFFTRAKVGLIETFTVLIATAS